MKEMHFSSTRATSISFPYSLPPLFPVSFLQHSSSHVALGQIRGPPDPFVGGVCQRLVRADRAYRADRAGLGLSPATIYVLRGHVGAAERSKARPDKVGENGHPGQSCLATAASDVQGCVGFCFRQSRNHVGVPRGAGRG